MQDIYYTSSKKKQAFWRQVDELLERDGGKSDYPEITRVAARLAEVSISAAREYMNELKSSAGPYELVGQGRERKLQKRLQRAS